MKLSRDYQWYLTSSSDLLQRIYHQQVVLERLFIRGRSIYGTIRVNNLSLHKQVSIKYTIDQWETSSFVDADYSIFYQDTNTDCFLFQLIVPFDRLKKVSEETTIVSLKFAICYSVNEQKYWDNNSSKDYTIDILTEDDNESSRCLSRQLINEFERKEFTREYCAVSHRSESTKSNPCGLVNIGGACYMNSVLQALAFTSCFTDYLSFQTLNSFDHLVTNECVNLFSLLHSHEYSLITPFPFKQIVGHLRHSYLKNQQNDAHEFLIFLLNLIQNELDQISNNSMVEQFYGIFRSTTKCRTCDMSSSTEEPFLTLSLPIVTKESCSLNNCLTQLQIEEHLDDCSWFCSKCQCRREATKTLVFHRLPKIFIVQLKRFEMNHQGELIKNDRLVEYPIENLQFNGHDNMNYSLYSVINHHGQLNDGHFTTMTRWLSPSSSSNWWNLDDDRIEMLSDDHLIKNDKAYLLFYTMNKY